MTTNYSQIRSKYWTSWSYHFDMKSNDGKVKLDHFMFLEEKAPRWIKILAKQMTAVQSTSIKWYLYSLICWWCSSEESWWCWISTKREIQMGKVTETSILVSVIFKKRNSLHHNYGQHQDVLYPFCSLWEPKTTWDCEVQHMNSNHDIDCQFLRHDCCTISCCFVKNRSTLMMLVII